MAFIFEIFFCLKNSTGTNFSKNCSIYLYVFLNRSNALVDKKEARNQLQFTITEKGFLCRKNIDSKILQRFRSCLVQNLFLIYL